ncbi:diaminobutyrate--2-oxoglutarate transaminase [Micromonospora sp. AMSO12t]|uniref:diaminobutyrate--2-oxoglutarate transaminase n=1 Tax=unclassified Micromonospora TaxID=2617518 RepID=UPI00124B263C|nr:diaminobutyrate--2-oxoglutarate transaminase [Micromonospora sp. AMSO12t]KAB1162087.1 diaminobutyrate--2-oxoglutarate transaminase [Micromonospora sp. AMSO12t]
MTVFPNDVLAFDEHESEVRLYCRKFPAVFTRGKGAWLTSEDGRQYLDFFCGAGALNYGHNPDWVLDAMQSYLRDDGILHGLDMYTSAKRTFIETFNRTILRPRSLTYRLQFCGPTGTDAVEAALKLARKATGRQLVVSFTGGFHGMSCGSLAVTGNRRARAAASVRLQDVIFVPYEDGPGGRFDSIAYLERLLDDPSSGADLPAAVIVESTQIESGVYPATADWLRALRRFTQERGVLLVCDEIQTGCGRTGTFFGFEHAGVEPDMVTLSKSIGGAGLPMSLNLIKPDLDVWKSGEHTGTFRGNQLAFVAGAAALAVWQDSSFLQRLGGLSARISAFAERLRGIDPYIVTRGRGMILGIDVNRSGGADRAEKIQQRCFTEGLIVELCGRGDEVIKLMPPLTIEEEHLEQGLSILETAIRQA